MIITHSGNYFDYDNITKDSIDIKDILTALTRINRYMGHSYRAYSVGEHTINCYAMAKEKNYTTRQKMLVLAHDFTEAYCGDVNTDLKSRLPEYKKIEKEIEMAIYDYIGIEPPTPEEELLIKKIDYTMLLVEMKKLTHHNVEEYIEQNKDIVFEEFINESLLTISRYNKPEEELVYDYLEHYYNHLKTQLEEEVSQ